MKVLSCRLQQCFWPVTMLLVEWSCVWKRTFETFIWARLSQSEISETYKLWASSFLSKCSKVDLNFKTTKEDMEKIFSFLDICIWVGCVKLSLLRREYLTSVVSLLTNSPELLYITKRNFFKLDLFYSCQ